MSEEGVLVIDDCFNEFWPEMSWAVANYLGGKNGLLPFAITPGKVLLCRPPMKATYQAMLRETFPQRIDKKARLYGHEALIVGVMPATLPRLIARTPFGAWVRSKLKLG